MISEILGYIGTVLVLISFIPKDIKKIRIINIFGCIVWIISAIFSKSYSVMTLNGILMIVHVVHLIKMKNEYRIHNDEYYIADKNGKHCEKVGCLNYGNSCRFCDEGDMYETIKGE